MKEFKVGQVYLDTEKDLELKVEKIDIVDNSIYYSGYMPKLFTKGKDGFYEFSLDNELLYLESGRYIEMLKIGDTFEYNGFICEVKEKIREKKWYYNTRTDKYVRTNHYGKHLKEITDKDFIKQLEENAK